MSDPQIQNPTDAIVRITSSGICGSDLHLDETLGPFMTDGDILGHEAMGIVEEVGSQVTDLHHGDRVVVPFQISCGYCFMCNRGLQTQCVTTQVGGPGGRPKLYGFSKLYGAVPGSQAEFLRVEHADYNAITVPEGPPEGRFLFLSEVLPTAWQSVKYAGIPDGGTLAVLGCGPIGDMASRIATHQGTRVITVDPMPDRLDRVRRFGAEVIDLRDTDNVGETIREMTGGQGPDSVIDAVGMEAHGSPGARMVPMMAGALPDEVAEKVMKTGGVDRLASLHTAIDVVRRAGTISVIGGLYGGVADPIPMMMFDKEIQMRMGQANVKRWAGDILRLLTDEDPLGVDDFATHRLPLSDGARGYEISRREENNTGKVVLAP